MKDGEKVLGIAQRIKKELDSEGLGGYRVLIYHESDTLEDILKLNSDAVKIDF
jgi:hypothetical protein